MLCVLCRISETRRELLDNNAMMLANPATHDSVWSLKIVVRRETDSTQQQRWRSCVSHCIKPTWSSWLSIMPSALSK